MEVLKRTGCATLSPASGPYLNDIPISPTIIETKKTKQKKKKRKEKKDAIHTDWEQLERTYHHYR